MNKKILAAAIATLASVFTLDASAATISYNYNGSGGAVAHSGAAFGTGYTFSTTNWNSLLTLPKFDTSLGTLTGAVLKYTGGFQTTGAIDSEDADFSTVTARVGVDLKFRGNGTAGSSDIGLGLTTQSLSQVLYDGDLEADDEAGAGNPNYTGLDSASGLSASGNSGLGSFTITNLAAISGTGNFSIFAQAAGSTSTSGSANLFYNILTQARSQISIDYTYTTVPEPGALGLIGLGFAGFSLLRKKNIA